jgi:predicted nuclease with TOPRIM domain
VTNQEVAHLFDTLRTDLRGYIDASTTSLRVEFAAEFSGLRGEVGGVRGEFANLRSEVGGVRGEFANLRSEFGDMRSEFANLRSEFGDLRDEFGDLRDEFGDLRGKFGDLRDEFGGLRGEFGDLHRYFDVTAEGLRHEIQLVAEGTLAVKEELKREIAELRDELGLHYRS